VAICVTQEGAIRIWQQILGISTIGYPYVHLFGSQHTPAHTDTEATYAAIELAAAGYAPILLGQPSANWTISAIGAGAQAVYLTVSWTFTAAATVWGYWLSDQTQTYSLWAEIFLSSFVYGSSGGPFTLQLQPWLASAPTVGGIPCP
jgi:hypothetical protein